MQEDAARNPKDVFYLRASAEENAHNLGASYFKDNKRRLPTLLYNAEILNIRPDKIEGGFYALLNEEIHTYKKFNYGYLDNLEYDVDKLSTIDSRQDDDVMHDMPLDISLDYGASINVLQTHQEYLNTSHWLKTLYVKHPYRLKDVLKQFCHYYRYHRAKVVHYWYDHTAVGTDATRITTYADEVISTLQTNGWQVVPHYIGQAPSHHSKYKLWSAALAGDASIPKQQINSVNSRVLLISMQHAPIKEGRNGFEKDKSSERNPKIDQAEATHPSDAADTILFGRYHNKLSSINQDFIPTVYSR